MSFTLRLATLRTIENDPGSEVVTKFHKAMLLAGRNKQRVAGRIADSLFAENECPGSALHDIDLVLLMRFLLVRSQRLVVTELHRAMLQQDAIKPVIGALYQLQGFFHGHSLSHRVTVARFRLKYSSLPTHQIKVKAFFKNLRGVIFFAGLTLNTIVWFIPIFILAIVKLLLPIPVLRHAIKRALMAIGENWISINWFLMRYAGSVTLVSRGLENLRRDGWYLVIANHQTWVDIVVLQAAFNRRIPFLKFFIKQQLIWFPFLGIAWWAMDMPFMKRFSASYLAKNPHMKGKDLETTRRACEKFRDTPTSVLNFIEGTRFSEEKRIARKSPYRNLLQPRAGGLAVALSSMNLL